MLSCRWKNNGGHNEGYRLHPAEYKGRTLRFSNCLELVPLPVGEDENRLWSLEWPLLQVRHHQFQKTSKSSGSSRDKNDSITSSPSLAGTTFLPLVLDHPLVDACAVGDPVALCGKYGLGRWPKTAPLIRNTAAMITSSWPKPELLKKQPGPSWKNLLITVLPYHPGKIKRSWAGT